MEMIFFASLLNRIDNAPLPIIPAFNDIYQRLKIIRSDQQWENLRDFIIRGNAKSGRTSSTTTETASSFKPPSKASVARCRFCPKGCSIYLQMQQLASSAEKPSCRYSGERAIN